MKILACQLDIIWEDRDANHQRVREMLAQANPSPGDMLVLPEMFASGFSLDVAKIADNPSGATQAFLAELARRHRIYIVGGIVMRADDGRGRNQAIVVGPDGAEIVRYHKIHPFSFGGETDRYSAGDHVVTFAWGDFVVAPFICYDLRFPEIFRHAIHVGANLFVIIANWPTARLHHWTTLLTARAIENQSYVAGVNRCGRDPNVEYPGRGMIVDPRGQILAQAGGEECVISASLNLNDLNAYRAQFPALRDRRFAPAP